MNPAYSHPPALRIFRLAAAVAGALALVTVLLHIFSPAPVALGEADLIGLELSQTGPNTAIAGQMITYTIYVTNNHSQVLTGVVITDSWNTQLYTGTYQAEGVTVNDFKLVTLTQPVYAQFSLADMAPTQRGVITVNMVISPNQQPVWNRNPIFKIDGNSVIASVSNPPGVPVAVVPRVDTTIVGPVLKLTKFVTPTQAMMARPGRLFTYTFRLENLNYPDAISATNAVITEKLPVNTIFYTAYPPSLAVYDSISNTVYFTLANPLPVSSTALVTLTLRVTPTLGNVDIPNLTQLCATHSDEIPLSIFCVQVVTTKADDAYEKVARTISPPAQTGSISRTYPNRVMSYTVHVYNPFPDPVTGILLTDTLPTASSGNPSQTFEYLGVVASGPPGPPTVISSSVRVVGWELPQIDGWGLYTFTFEAFVPPQMPIDPNVVEKTYNNPLIGTYGSINLPYNDGGHDNHMRVNVVRQIDIGKTVTPTTQTFGKFVTYTLAITNNGPTPISNIYLTDTLPTRVSSDWCAFDFAANIDSQQFITGNNNLVAWGPFTLAPYESRTIGSFRAQVFGGLNATCRNTMEGYSPDTYIVRMTLLAPVVVEVPFRYTKNVDKSNVVLGETIQYTVREWNVGGVPATMDYFFDNLPSGFFANDNPVYFDDLIPNLVLPANDLSGTGGYQQTFTVLVSSTNQCDILPEPIPQAAFTFGMGIIDPPELAGEWVNASAAATVNVLPHATVRKTSALPGALPGDLVTYTIVLSNNKSYAITNVTVSDTLPNGYTFNTVLPGTPPPVSTVPPFVIWQGQTIPANGTTTLAFVATAPMAVGSYPNNVKAFSLDNAFVCIPKLDPALNVPVKLGIVEASKTATPVSVGPFSVFQYNIALKNIGPYTVTLSRFTETLPGFDNFKWTYVSMQSGDPVPDASVPYRPVWTNLTIGPDQTRNLRVNVRTSPVVGTFPNYVTSTPPVGAGFMTATLPSRWIITRTSNYNNAPVTVLPGVGLLKEVDRPSAIAGESVVYTITLVNISSGAINNVRITDTLPTGFVFQQVVAGDVPAPASTNPLVFTLSNVPNSAPNNRKTIVFRVTIPLTQPSGTYYNNVSATANEISIAPTGPIAPVIVSGVPALSMSKSVVPATVIAGREVTYTIHLENTDDNEAVVNARITDTLPANFSYVAMVSGPNPTLVAGKPVWTNINVSPGGSLDLVFRALVSPSAADGLYFNRVDGSSGSIVFNGTGDTAQVNVVSPVFDVQVSKSDGSITGTIGGSVVYTIRYTNTQNTLGLAAQAVVLTETFSPASYLTADAPNWNFVSAGVYTRLIGDLPANTSGVVTFGLAIDAGIPEEYLGITNTVRIGAQGAVGEPAGFEQVTANNVWTDIDTIRGPDLVVVGVAVLTPNPSQGRVLTVVVTLKNQGLDATQGVSSGGGDPGGWFGMDLYVKPANAPPPTGPSDRYLGLCSTASNPCSFADLRFDLYKVTKEPPPPYGSGLGLAPGETVAVTYTYVLPDGGVKWLYVQADPFWNDGQAYSGTSGNGRIREGDEQNNIYGPVVINVNRALFLPLIRKN
jgi:uncharacterized repeat protein (TIGR01451 family)